MQISYDRDMALNSGIHHSALTRYVNGTLTANGKKYKIKTKLKGTNTDHWKHPTKWSLKIKIKGLDRLFGLKVFSIMHPATRSYNKEWLYQKLLEYEGFISGKIKYVDVIINGEERGIYILQEEVSKILIERNKRREGPIIYFSKEIWTETQKRSEKYEWKGDAHFFLTHLKLTNQYPLIITITQPQQYL